MEWCKSKTDIDDGLVVVVIEEEETVVSKESYNKWCT
jgi:hypothetical protein